MPAAMAYLFWLSAHGGIGFGQDAPTTILLIAAGAVTTVPLLLFATAAHRLPMATLGLLQYLAPSMQFLCGILLFGERLTAGQMTSFALIRSEEHTSELQSLMRTSYAVFCLKKKNTEKYQLTRTVMPT